jgi:hypothetical protein
MPITSIEILQPEIATKHPKPSSGATTARFKVLATTDSAADENFSLMLRTELGNATLATGFAQAGTYPTNLPVNTSLSDHEMTFIVGVEIDSTVAVGTQTLYFGAGGAGDWTGRSDYVAYTIEVIESSKTGSTRIDFLNQYVAHGVSGYYKDFAYVNNSTAVAGGSGTVAEPTSSNITLTGQGLIANTSNALHIGAAATDNGNRILMSRINLTLNTATNELDETIIKFGYRIGNGTPVYLDVETLPTTGLSTVLSFSHLLTVSSGDEINIVVEPDQGCTVDITGTVTEWSLAAVAAPPSGGSGEANTASNVGTEGIGIFKQKTAEDLEFYNVVGGRGNKASLDGDNIVIDSEYVREYLRDPASINFAEGGESKFVHLSADASPTYTGIVAGTVYHVIYQAGNATRTLNKPTVAKLFGSLPAGQQEATGVNVGRRVKTASISNGSILQANVRYVVTAAGTISYKSTSYNNVGDVILGDGSSDQISISGGTVQEITGEVQWGGTAATIDIETGKTVEMTIYVIGTVAKVNISEGAL